MIVIIGKRSEGKQEYFIKSHNLAKLWKESQSAMMGLHRNKERHWSIDQIENKINILDVWDEDSTYFRYPRIENSVAQRPNLHKLAWTCERIYKRLMLLSEDMWNRFAQQE